MSEGRDPSDPSDMDQLLEEASLWFARMRGPDAEVFRADFEKWLALGAAHRGAYNRAGEIFALGRFLAQEQTVQNGYGSSRQRHRGDWRGWAIAATVFATLCLGAWAAATHWWGQHSQGDHQFARASSAHDTDITSRTFSTAGLGISRQRLPDGSIITLDSDSLLHMAFSRSKRELRLDKGRVRFDVAHEARPFVVLAGGGSVTAKGTIFDVTVEGSDRVTVHLFRGAIDVARPAISREDSSEPARITRLEVGEEFSFGTPGLTGSLSASLRDSMKDTRDPADFSLVREFDEQPLGSIIALANKGSVTQIRLGNPELADVRVSGRFRIDDSVQVAERLAHLLELQEDRTRPDEIWLRRN